MTEVPCDHCSGQTADRHTSVHCGHCKGTGVMYEVMIVKTPDGGSFVMHGWDTEEAKESFGETLEILHLRAYPKE